MEIEPVIASGIMFLLGQSCLTPCTRLIMAITKHGIKTKRIKHPMTMRMSMNSHMTIIIPKNAIITPSRENLIPFLANI